jgi:uncharacterized protein YjiK
VSVLKMKNKKNTSFDNHNISTMILKSFFSTFLIILACQNNITNVAKDPNVPYQLAQPTTTLTVKQPDLQEISGICFTDDGKNIVTLQDENGILFWLNKENGTIERQVLFKPEGDFEDLAFANGNLYVLRSKGVLSVLENYEEEAKVKMVSFSASPLSKTADTEGLCHDAKNNRLLITCKGATSDPFKRAVWAFDLATQQYSSSPIFEISLADVQQYLTSQKADKEEFKKFFDQKEIAEFNFGPSGIAVHPISGDYYILSSVGKILVVTDEKGKVKGIEKLSKKIHAQPEGIAFDKDGTLYISNEGKNEDAPKILIFKNN